MYQILERLLKDELQERIPLQARYLVIHSTANPSVGDEAHFKWLDSARQDGWAHYYLDWDSISQLVPEGLVAPAQGPNGNKAAISIEICEGTSQAQFDEAWKRAVWLAADIMHRYNWPMGCLYSHADITKMYPQDTDHTDPIAFFQKFGKRWEDFIQDVRAQLDILNRTYPPADPWREDIITELMKTGLLSQRRHPNQPVLWWEEATMLLKLRNEVLGK
jgi:hypothetical protein